MHALEAQARWLVRLPVAPFVIRPRLRMAQAQALYSVSGALSCSPVSKQLFTRRRRVSAYPSCAGLRLSTGRLCRGLQRGDLGSHPPAGCRPFS